jgi:nucleoid DNA-binding protein
MALTKAAIIDRLTDELGLPRNKSIKTVESLLEIIKFALESGDDVLMPGFGKFCVRDKKARIIQPNPVPSLGLSNCAVRFLISAELPNALKCRLFCIVRNWRIVVNKFPVFHRETNKLHQPDFEKNIWCPFYEDCLEEAARLNLLMDCSQCENAKVNYKEHWKFKRIYILFQ